MTAPALPSHDAGVGAGRRYMTLAAIVLTAALVLAMAEGPLASVLRRAGLLATPDHFTALYFTDGKSLPARVAPGAPVGFSFTIDNREQRRTDYRWVCLLVSGATTTQLASGAVAVTTGASSAVGVVVTIPELAQPSIVRVVLQHPAQNIDFRLAATAPGA